MEDNTQMVAATYAELNPLTLPEQLRVAIDLLDSSPPMSDSYLALLVGAIERHGRIDSSVVITTVLMLRIAHLKMDTAASTGAHSKMSTNST